MPKHLFLGKLRIPGFFRSAACSWAALIVAGLLGAGCMDDNAQGGGSETMLTGVAGKVVDESGQPMAGAEVRIRPEGALPPALAGEPAGEPEAVTAADGTFLIHDLHPGGYFVDCRGENGAALIAARVEDSLVRLPDAVLRPTGALKGVVRRLGESSANAVYVYIRGLPGQAVAWDRGPDSMAFVLADIPAGMYTVVLQPSYPVDLAQYQILEIPGVRVEPGDTLDLDSLSLPLRSAVQDPAYSRDSAAWTSVLRANGGGDSDLGRTSAVVGNRITMLFVFDGTLRNITPEIGVLDQVEYLSLMAMSSNPATLQVSPEVGRLRGLRRFGLQGYLLDSLPGWIDSFPELANTWFQSAGLEAFPERLTDIPTLVTLSLADNEIPSLPGSVAKLRRLRGLDMRRNRLSSLPPELFKMESLVALGLGDNEFTSLPPELMAMDNLKGVNIRNNRLCGLSAEWKAWLTRQDSLMVAGADPLSTYGPVDDPGWEATQRCGTP
jgi:hypothetical protein